MATATETRRADNGAAADDPMVAALASEAAIADEATAIRGDAAKLDAKLFMQLWPLLKRPIPEGFIQHVPPTQGKPYDSTGIRSVQVQIDRMNNVLTPMWWWDATEYEEQGSLARVTVYVGNPGEEPLTSRSSYGGVARGTGAGNIYKGSYTNAAKLAFARLGPGHEVYLGATDLDPDVHRDLAEQTKGADDPATIGADIAKKMVDRAFAIPGVKEQLQLAASHAAERDVGDCSTKAKATKALASLTYGQAEKLDRWIVKKGGGSDGGE